MWNGERSLESACFAAVIQLVLQRLGYGRVHCYTSRRGDLVDECSSASTRAGLCMDVRSMRWFRTKMLNDEVKVNISYRAEDARELLPLP